MNSASREPTLRARAKKDQIRAGAKSLFLKRGFAAGTDDIAREAGVSKQTLYSYYPSKEDLLADVLRNLVEEGTRDGTFEVVEGASPEDREGLRRALLSMAHGLVAGLMDPEYVALVRVVIAETPRLPHLGRLFASEVPGRVLGDVAALLEAGKKESLIGNDVDTEAASRAFMGPLLTYVLIDGLFVGDGPPKPPSSNRIEAVVDLLMEAVGRR